MHGATFVTDLAIVLGVAAVTSVAARLLRQPTILGYLVAGLIVGPYLPIPLFADTARVEALAEFGVILVMFAIGLEFRIARLISVLPLSGFAGLVQISFLLWCGFSLGQILGWSTVESVFLGACVAISSTMVVSRVFDQKPVSKPVRRFVLGVLVIQDVVAVALIAAMTGIAAGGGVGAGELASTLGELAAVLLAMLAVGLLAVPRITRAVTRLNSREILAVVSIGICFATALLAEKFGYSVALGAFIAGVLVAESGKGFQVGHLIEPVRDMFAAIFFVSIGMTVDPSQAWTHLPTALLVAAVVVTAQFFSISTAGILSGAGLRTSVAAGLSLGQIGEFAFIIAAIGTGAGVVRGSLQPVLVTVAVMTAFTTPLLLGASDWAVRFVDRRLPRRLQHFLSLYEDWLLRFRNRPPEARAGKPVPRALRALAFDALGVTAVLAVSLTWLARAGEWLSRKLSLEASQSRLFLEIAVVLILLPLLFALVRNTLSLSRLVSRSIAPLEEAAGAAARIAGRTLRTMVYLGVVVGVGAPMVAVLRPFAGAGYGIGLLAAVLLGLGVHLWRSAGAIEREFQSGAEQVAEVLARQTSEEEAEDLSDPSLLPGLDGAVRLRLEPDGFAVGKSLAQLELRARTGATVLAIQRGESNLRLPSAAEKLQPGDLLAVIGAGNAVARARELLAAGPASLDQKR